MRLGDGTPAALVRSPDLPGLAMQHIRKAKLFRDQLDTRQMRMFSAIARSILSDGQLLPGPIASGADGSCELAQGNPEDIGTLSLDFWMPS